VLCSYRFFMVLWIVFFCDRWNFSSTGWIARVVCA